MKYLAIAFLLFSATLSAQVNKRQLNDPTALLIVQNVVRTALFSVTGDYSDFDPSAVSLQARTDSGDHEAWAKNFRNGQLLGMLRLKNAAGKIYHLRSELLTQKALCREILAAHYQGWF